MKTRDNSDHDKLTNWQLFLVSVGGWVVVRGTSWLFASLLTNDNSQLLALIQVFILTFSNALLIAAIVSLLVVAIRCGIRLFNRTDRKS